VRGGGGEPALRRIPLGEPVEHGVQLVGEPARLVARTLRAQPEAEAGRPEPADRVGDLPQRPGDPARQAVGDGRHRGRHRQQLEPDVADVYGRAAARPRGPQAASVEPVEQTQRAPAAGDRLVPALARQTGDQVYGDDDVRVAERAADHDGEERAAARREHHGHSPNR
jgi:hypothetical protein